MLSLYVYEKTQVEGKLASGGVSKTYLPYEDESRYDVQKTKIPAVLAASKVLAIGFVRVNVIVNLELFLLSYLIESSDVPETC